MNIKNIYIKKKIINYFPKKEKKTKICLRGNGFLASNAPKHTCKYKLWQQYKKRRQTQNKPQNTHLFTQRLDSMRSKILSYVIFAKNFSKYQIAKV